MEKSLPHVLAELFAAGFLSDECGLLRLMRLVILPRPSQLTHLVAGPLEGLCVSSEDTAEFYNSPLWPAAWERERGGTAGEAPRARGARP